MDRYDIAIIGGGMAGLSAAINAAGDGHRTVLLERGAQVGGQIRHSTAIENLAGYAVGISGPELVNASEFQATAFGADIRLNATVADIVRDGDDFVLPVIGGCGVIVSRSVLVAAGLTWRSLEIHGADKFYGRGFHYGMDYAAAESCRGGVAVVVGGANSAGQAALHLSQLARKVVVVVRGDKIGTSHYLTERLKTLPNVEIVTGCEVEALDGTERVESVTLRIGDQQERLNAGLVCVFIGAEPATEWLPAAVARDERGFIIADGTTFKTTLEGVYAVGDIRNGIAKRVSAAIGEGAASVSSINRYLVSLPVRVATV
jgi:thioredoxin reductase (NADPH)